MMSNRQGLINRTNSVANVVEIVDGDNRPRFIILYVSERRASKPIVDGRVV